MTDFHDEHDRAAPEERPEEADPSPGSQETLQQPAAERAVVTHYGYDPQTFEILCRPGQRLNARKIKRLQELELYAYVVTLAE